MAVVAGEPAEAMSRALGGIHEAVNDFVVSVEEPSCKQAGPG
jgi:hypothetical protein